MIGRGNYETYKTAWSRLCKPSLLVGRNLNNRANSGAFLPKREVCLWPFAPEQP